MHTSRWPSPIAAWYSRIAQRPAYSPLAPEQGCREVASIPVTCTRWRSRSFMSARRPWTRADGMNGCTSVISDQPAGMRDDTELSFIVQEPSVIREVHPFMPSARVQGLRALMNDLERHLVHVTGMDATSLQPCSGASGEYAGLCAIREYQAAMGEGHRDVCIIPKSAHGTNPASAAVANMRVVWVDDSKGMPLDELKKVCEEYKDSISALMVTYPSTQGIFETSIVEVCDMIHSYGGQVYMD